MKAHNLDTTNWNSFPFSARGVNFISKIAPHSPLLPQIAKLPAGLFDEMNKSAVYDLLTEFNSMQDLINGLQKVNEHATHAVIELA